MDVFLDDEALALKKSAAEFGHRELNADLEAADRPASFGRESWDTCAAFGIQGLPMPETYGGAGQTTVNVVAAMEGLGYGCRDNGLLFALGAQMWSVQMPILLFGSDEQKTRYLPALISGESIGAHAVTEPESGSDVFSLRTTATRSGDGWIVRGAKTFITSAPVANVFLTLATTDASLGSRGLVAFLVDRETPGVTVSRPFMKMGLHTSQLAEVAFDCAVGESQRLGKEGGGSAVFQAAMEWERAFILAPALGSMQRQIETCIGHARSRRQFGRPIAENQAVSHRVVDMQRRIDIGRLLVYRTAALKDARRRLTREPSEVKLHISESWVANSLDALQLHGAYGYMAESGVERELRDALASKIYSGTSEIQRSVIAAYLGV